MTKISAIITAGGISSRFGSNKLLEQINGMPMICATIKQFEGIVDEIIVPTDLNIQKIIRIYFKDVKFAPFGACRQKSVLNGLKACNYPDYVLIHDGARPFIDKNIILNTIKEVKLKDAVVCAVNSVDTIKICDEEGKIVDTPPRNTLFCAQTPQAFKYSLILEAHLAFQDELEKFTDDSSLAEKFGHSVYVVRGDYANKKITTKADLS